MKRKKKEGWDIINMKNLLEDIFEKVLANEDIAICIASGVEMVHEFKEEKDGLMKYILKTKYPVKIERDKNGNPIEVRILKT